MDSKSHLHMYSGQRSRFLRQGEQIRSGFNPLVAGKKDGFRTRDDADQRRFFWNCSRMRKPCFSDKSYTIDEKYRFSIQYSFCSKSGSSSFETNPKNTVIRNYLVFDYFLIFYLYSIKDLRKKLMKRSFKTFYY